MNIEDLNKLEEKVKKMVTNLELLRNENAVLTEKLKDLRNESSINNTEKDQIKKRVKSLIKLIESIEDES